jgi:hypothetical protein
VAEGVLTALYVRGTLEPTAVWLMEDHPEGRTVRFDPLRGYRLSSTHPARMACVASDGTVEAVGTVRGNNQGFPDRDDFGPARDRAGARRLAVLGRSFTAAQFLEINWPDRAEDLTRDGDTPLQLLNLSIDAGGLVNWWSVLIRIVEAEAYDLDGIVVAVNRFDLYRGFAIWDETLGSCPHGHRCLAQGFVPGFEPGRLPADLEQAARWFTPMAEWTVLPPDELDLILAGEAPVPLGRPLEPYLGSRLGTLACGPSVAVAQPQDPWSACGDRCHGLIADMRRFSEQAGLPVMVVYIPDRGEAERQHTAEARQLARALGAEYVDGQRAFEDLDREELAGHYLHRDGHWNQRGSDRFAGFAAELLTGWEAAGRPLGAP